MFYVIFLFFLIQGNRPVSLVGFSLGARVIFFCLEELCKRKGKIQTLMQLLKKTNFLMIMLVILACLNFQYKWFYENLFVKYRLLTIFLHLLFFLHNKAAYFDTFL